MKKNKKTIIRPGDRIKIINPEFFVRCGYPLNKEAGLKLITEDEKKKVSELVGLNHIPTVSSLQFYNSFLIHKENIYNNILDRLAYLKIKEAGFGGNERKIFTELKEKYRNCECIIYSKRIVQTGIRECYSDGDWESSYYSSIPYLSQQKSHVILKINVIDNNYLLENLEIEEKNVIKL